MPTILNRNLLIAVLIILIVAFGSLSVFIYHHLIWKFDTQVSLVIQHYQANWLDKVMVGISFFGELPFSLISVLIVAYIFYWKKYKREALFISTTLLSGLIILGVKNIINRPRPTSFYVRLVDVYRFQSYPSGHTLSYVLFFGFLIILMFHLKGIPKTTKWIVTSISAFLIVMVAPSRIYLGAHWFTDTLGGFLLGLICLYPLCYFYFKQVKKTR
ncbi:phosphatase PAP2 family protein [Pedobacter endophyticus]|uniref:Phosphatase PAP2 family protein n=1 Tax=Pedobacter endophyticus TaxID=2789740 RepID=A0A7S9L0U2_9SPHI|nr:phosphatase PAP2 family protein [Pedobacter endophyticus]QPH40394.1 phosphatase PAP2 family protein [Pedobacter endophyticus]